MQAISIRTKIFVIIVGTIIFSGLLIIFAVRTTLVEKLQTELMEKGVFMSRHLAAMSADSQLTENHLYLQLMLNEYLVSDDDTLYVFVQDAEGEIVAHSFEQGFPVDLKGVNLPVPGQKYNVKSIRLGENRVLDIATPVVGGFLGTVHVGLSEKVIRESADTVVLMILMVIISVLVVSGGVAFIFSNRVTNPLIRLLEAVKQVGRGGQERKVEIRANDEVGELGLAFNRMIDDLQNTTVSREEYQKQARFLQNVLESIPNPFYVIDAADYSIILANSATSTVDEWLGSTCYALTHKRDKPCGLGGGCLCPLDEVKLAKKTVVVEHIHLDRDNNKRYYEVHGYPVFDQDGNVIQMIESSLDITERKHSEEVLKALLEDLAQVKREWEGTMDCIQDMIILVDGQGKIIRCNQAVRIFFNISPREVIGRNWVELCQNGGLLLQDGTGEEEARHLPSGRWFSVKRYGYGSDQGASVEKDLAQQVITLNEVTEIKNISAELEKKNTEIDSSRLKLQEALDALSLLIQRVANFEDFTVRYQNPDMKRCYEIKECGQEDCACFGKEPMRCWQVTGTFCRNEVQGGFSTKIKNCMQCEVYLDATRNPIFMIGEQFNNMMHILVSINSELLHAYEQLQMTQAKILQSEKMASIGQLAAGVAHEINNPMGFISSNIGTLNKYVGKMVEFMEAQGEVLGSMQALDRVAGLRKELKLDYILDDTKDLIEESLDGADRVKKIVQNLKSFSRVDQAEENLSDINECLETTLNIVWNELKYKATVHKDYGDLPLTFCYPQQLNQVFMNLLINAAQAIDEQGEITIRTWEDDNQIKISIADTGSGIPADKVGKIFEPFFTTKEVGKGTGLGLSIVYEIIQTHHGEITVDSEEGRGTTFTMSIPVMAGKNE